MIRKDKHKFADGSFKTQIRVVEGYRDIKTRKPKQKTIKSFGYLEDNIDQESFMKMVEEFDKNYKRDKIITFNKSKSTLPFYECETSKLYNFGYKYIESVYDTLELDSIFDTFVYKGTHCLKDVFKFLVISRILNPDSKRSTYQLLNLYYDNNLNSIDKVSLDEIYRMLDHFSKHSCSIQKYINDKIKSLIGRNTENVFYDVTNYYFEKDYNDEDTLIEIPYKKMTKTQMKNNQIIELEVEGQKKLFKVKHGLRHKGVSKDHKTTPIVQLGLLMDENGLPINYRLFSGNTSDCKTLQPIMKDVKEDYNLKRLIVVADKGMNSNDNIDKICNSGDGYVFSQILRGKKGSRYHKDLFDESGYVVVSEDYKYKLLTEEYDGLDENGKKITRKRQVLLYYNGAEARRTKHKREEKLLKAEVSLTNNAYLLDHSYKKYIKTDNIIKETGELATETIVSIDYEKATEEEKFDGYFCIVTSELNFNEEKIRQIYHGLWRIEETFKISKQNIEIQPIYLRTESHINGHFLTCFVSLVVIRMLQYKMGYTISVERIVNSINMCCCSEITNGVMHLVLSNEKLAYKQKYNKNGEKYSTLKLDDKTETKEDFKEIIKYFEGKACESVVNKSVFDKYIKSIKFKIN